MSKFDNTRQYNDSRRREPTTAELEAIALEQSFVRPLPEFDKILRGDYYDMHTGQDL